MDFGPSFRPNMMFSTHSGSKSPTMKASCIVVNGGVVPNWYTTDTIWRYHQLKWSKESEQDTFVRMLEEFEKHCRTCVNLYSSGVCSD